MSHFVRRAVNPKRPKVEPIRNPTLFPMEKLEKTAELAGELSPHLTAREAQQLARQTRTFAEIFAATRPGPLPDHRG